MPGGKAFAGGLKMGSPLGAIYSTNITPDPETGIGNYTLQDFDRAVRQGVAKDGHRLYPAMPYPSYAKLTDDDVKALYDFFMKDVPAVRQANKPNEIPSYLSFRWPLAIWNLVFTSSGSYVAKPEHDAVWNRGAYLVRGARPLRRLPHAARLGLSGKGARREQCELSLRRRARRLVARRTCAAISAPGSADGRKPISRSSSRPATTTTARPSAR